MFWIKKAVTAAVAVTLMIAAAGVMVGVGIQGNSQSAIAQGQQKPDTVNQDRFLFARAYSHLLRLDIEENSSNSVSTDHDILLSHLLVFQKLYGLNPVIPLEVRVTGYRSPEAELAYYRNRLQYLLKSSDSEKKVVKEIEEKIKYLEKWKIYDSEKGPFTIAEHETLDDNGLNSSCWNKTALTKHLTRIHRDEKAPKEIMIVIAKTAPPERIANALKAAYDAGFKAGRIYLHPDNQCTITGLVLRKEGDFKLLELKTDDFSRLTVTPKK